MYSFKEWFWKKQNAQAAAPQQQQQQQPQVQRDADLPAQWKADDGVRDDKISLGYIFDYLQAQSQNNQPEMAKIKAQIDKSGYDDRLAYYLKKCKQAFSQHAGQFSSYDRYPDKGQEFNCITAIPELAAIAKQKGMM